jgi:hypothetical protein
MASNRTLDIIADGGEELASRYAWIREARERQSAARAAERAEKSNGLSGRDRAQVARRESRDAIRFGGAIVA